MKASEVKDLLEAEMINQWGDVSWEELQEADEVMQVSGLGEVKVVDFQDDRNNTARWIILKVGEDYYRQSGYHVSHDGTYWDGGFTKVVAKEKVVTVWNEI